MTIVVRFAVEHVPLNLLPSPNAGRSHVIAHRLVCEWHGESIIVLGAVRIDPPYTAKDCRSLDGDKTRMDRAILMVSIQLRTRRKHRRVFPTAVRVAYIDLFRIQAVRGSVNGSNVFSPIAASGSVCGR